MTWWDPRSKLNLTHKHIFSIKKTNNKAILRINSMINTLKLWAIHVTKMKTHHTIEASAAEICSNQSSETSMRETICAFCKYRFSVSKKVSNVKFYVHPKT